MTEPIIGASPRSRARVAGVLYLITIAAGYFAFSARTGRS